MTLEQEIKNSMWTKIEAHCSKKEIEIKAWSTTDKKEAPEVIAVVKKNKVIYNSDCVKIDRYARRIVKEAKEMMLKN